MWPEERKAERSLKIHLEILQLSAVYVVDTGRKQQHKQRSNTHRKEYSFTEISLYRPLPSSPSPRGGGLTATVSKSLHSCGDDSLTLITTLAHFSGTQFPLRSRVHILVLHSLLSLKFSSRWMFSHIAKKSFWFLLSPCPSLVSPLAMEDMEG